jgi:hypothetical protein
MQAAAAAATPGYTLKTQQHTTFFFFFGFYHFSVLEPVKPRPVCVSLIAVSSSTTLHSAPSPEPGTLILRALRGYLYFPQLGDDDDNDVFAAAAAVVVVVST